MKAPQGEKTAVKRLRARYFGRPATARPARSPLALLLLGIGLGAFLPACKKGASVTGRVTHAQTGQPVSVAKVRVTFQRLDANMNWMDAGRAEPLSGPDGKFSVDNPDMRARFTVLVERDGFYPNYDCPPLRRLEHGLLQLIHHVEVQLQPVVSPKALPRGRGEIRFYPPGRRMGWNFAQARTAPEAESDIVGEPDEAQQAMVFMAARGSGGFIRARGLSGEYVLYNMPTAPPQGYEPRVDVRQIAEEERACYYVRLADGAHYGKIEVSGHVKSREFVGLRFYWVFQPDGSGALEIPLEASPR